RALDRALWQLGRQRDALGCGLGAEGGLRLAHERDKIHRLARRLHPGLDAAEVEQIADQLAHSVRDLEDHLAALGVPRITRARCIIWAVSTMPAMGFLRS